MVLRVDRTCWRCDVIFRVASVDVRVYCRDCRTAYGFPAPAEASAVTAAPVLAVPIRGEQLDLFEECA